MAAKWLLTFAMVSTLALGAALPLQAQTVDFGDDSSPWANDDECDDPRFTGSGMTGTRLLDSDRMSDASDCRKAYEAGELKLRDGETGATEARRAAAPPATGVNVVDGIDFGDDSGKWALDDECDDPRFIGRGMTETQLLEMDRMRDATDCRKAYEAGELRLRGPGEEVEQEGRKAEVQAPPVTGVNVVDGIDFGDDSSEWANDDECDDPRFTGPGMTDTPLLDMDRMRDATDCRKAYEAGELKLQEEGDQAGADDQTEGAGGVSAGGINFGNDNSRWANDGECDDPRFTGPGMTKTTLLDSDRMRDATDCRKAFEAGRLQLKN